MVLEPLGGDGARIVRIKGGAVGQSQNFSGMGVFDDHRAGFGVGLLHRGFQFALSDVLDLLVDGENNVFSRLGLLFHAAKPFLVGIDRDEHSARFAA